MSGLLGFISGFITAIPVAGPISALVFSRGMEGKAAQGRAIALGAAFVEAIYVFLAFWGFSQIAPHFPRVYLASNLLAAVILAALGVYFFRSQKLRHPAVSSESSFLHSTRAFFIGAGVSGMNFSVLATWGALIATLYSMELLHFSGVTAVLFSLGVAGGIFAWFALGLQLIVRFRDRMNAVFIDRVLKGLGALLFLLSLAVLFRLLVRPS